MIFTEFAPNETPQDAFLALKLLFQPWRWRNGKETNNLKRRLKSRFFSSDTTVSFFFTGRAALYQYISSLQLQKHDEILVQAFTCEAVILPLQELGLVPKYVDIHASDFTMNISDLEKKYTPKAKVIIIQHTFGITPKDRNALISFAKQHNLKIIEDVAHGFDQRLFRKKRFPGAVLLSFGRSKFFSSVFGGAIAVRGVLLGSGLKTVEKNMANPSFWMILHILVYKIISVLIIFTYNLLVGKIIHFLFKQFDLFVPEVTKQEKQGQFNTIFLKTYPNAAAVLMHKQLDRFNDVYAIRKRISKLYDSQFNTTVAHGLSLLRYPVLVDSPKKIKLIAKKQGIQLGRWYSQVIAPDELDTQLVQYIPMSCPVAESVCLRIVNLPTNISISQAKRVVKILTHT